MAILNLEEPLFAIKQKATTMIKSLAMDYSLLAIMGLGLARSIETMTFKNFVDNLKLIK